MKTAILSCTLLFCGAAFTQTAAPGLAPDRTARIDALLNQYVEQSRIAGAVALVLRDGKPVYERAVGWADKEAGRRMTPTTIFRIASQTKALTSTAILALVEEGKIGINRTRRRLHPHLQEDHRRRQRRFRRHHRSRQPRHHDSGPAHPYCRHLLRNRAPDRLHVRGERTRPRRRQRLVHRR